MADPLILKPLFAVQVFPDGKVFLHGTYQGKHTIVDVPPTVGCIIGTERDATKQGRFEVAIRGPVLQNAGTQGEHFTATFVLLTTHDAARKVLFAGGSVR